jgi:hypothetical protein
MHTDKDPYSNYDLDDWQWEFLRRNARYKRAYKVVEWLKKRLEKKPASFSGGGKSFVAFGTSYWFSPVFLSDRLVWRYDEKWPGDEGDMELGWYLDLPSPEESSQEYKAKILRMRKPRAVVKLGEWSDEDETHYEIRPPFEEYKLVLLVDARYDTDRITSELTEVISSYKSKNRYHLELYSDYLKVWQLRKDNVRRSKIASSLWPHDYKKNKTNAIQKTRYCEQKFQELIDNSFPAKKHSPKNKK